MAVTVELALNAIPLRIYDLPTAVLWPVAFSAFTLLRVAADSSISPGLRTPGESHSEVAALRIASRVARLGAIRATQQSQCPCDDTRLPGMVAVGI